MTLRLILVSNPCCIPRLNRRTATFGDGYEMCQEKPDWMASYEDLQFLRALRLPELSARESGCC